VTVAWLSHGYAACGERARARALLANLEDLASEKYVSPYHRALAWLGAGDCDRAIALLLTASEHRDPSITNLAIDPRFERLGSDGRFRSLVERLGVERVCVE
jgi:hypothetical protein